MLSNNKLQERYEEIGNALSKLSKEWKNRFNKLPQEYIELTKEIEQIKMYAEIYQHYEDYNKDTELHTGIEDKISEKSEKRYEELKEKLNKPLFINKLKDKLYANLHNKINMFDISESKGIEFDELNPETARVWDSIYFIKQLRGYESFDEGYIAIENYLQTHKLNSESVEREVYWFFYENMSAIDFTLSKEELFRREALFEKIRSEQDSVYLDSIKTGKEGLSVRKLRRMTIPNKSTTNPGGTTDIDHEIPCINIEDFITKRDLLKRLVRPEFKVNEDNTVFAKVGFETYGYLFSLLPTFEKLNDKFDLKIPDRHFHTWPSEDNLYDRYITEEVISDLLLNRHDIRRQKEYNIDIISLADKINSSESTYEQLLLLRKAIFQQYTNKLIMNENSIVDLPLMDTIRLYSHDFHTKLLIAEDIFLQKHDNNKKIAYFERQFLDYVSEKSGKSIEELEDEGKVQYSFDGLISELDVSGMDIQDYFYYMRSPGTLVSIFKDLTSLDFSNTNIDDIEMLPGKLVGLCNLEYIDLSNTPITDISAASDLLTLAIHLKKLDLSDTNLSGTLEYPSWASDDRLPGHKSARSIEHLDISNTGINAISNGKDMRINYLDISDTPISHLKEIAKIGGLDTLDISGTAVSSIYPLLKADQESQKFSAKDLKKIYVAESKVPEEQIKFLIDNGIEVADYEDYLAFKDNE